VGVQIVVLTSSDDNVAAVNSILREGGHASHCHRLDDQNELPELLAGQPRSQPLDLLLLFADESRFDVAAVARLLARREQAPPLLLARERVDEQSIADAMECGARDVVSLTHRNRLLAVIERELQAHRLRLTLDKLLSSANSYKQELRELMAGASDAIVDIQEGIIVAANPAWLALLGHPEDADLTGEPFMDLFRKSDRPGLKGALVACLKDKWQGDALHVVAHQADGNELPLDIRLEKVSIDGEPAVRVLVPMDSNAEKTPTELLESAVCKDPSTGFYHRHYFLQELETRLAQPLGGGVRAMVYIRPDNFARVHKDIGLLATEALLLRLAELLREFMQPSDLYGRFGGTMFVALLERGTMSDVEAWAEGLRKAVAEQVFEVEQQSTTLTCTIGLVEVDQELHEPAALLVEAEKACRQGREAGGNRVQLARISTGSTSIRQADALWVPRLRHALMKNRLRLVHQPVTSLNEEIEGVFDTRVRLLDEQDELILPSEFMPAAERNGLVKNIDRWVIGASFSFCAAKRPNLVFVRLSRDSLIDDTLFDWLQARLQNTRVRPAQICFQVMEEVVSQHLKHAKSVAGQLRSAGFLFAVDHLGTGRDSQQVLKHVPMDYVKIDGSLMQGLHRNPENQRLVGQLATLAREQQIHTIAERVEDANTMAVLWQLGIAHIQGNYSQMHGVVLEDTQTIRGLNARTGSA